MPNSDLILACRNTELAAPSRGHCLAPTFHVLQEPLVLPKPSNAFQHASSMLFTTPTEDMMPSVKAISTSVRPKVALYKTDLTPLYLTASI